MPIDFYPLAHKGIQSLTPYVPGKSIEALAQEQGLTDIIKLAGNENPLGCSPLVKHALEKLSPSRIATYPAATHHPLHNKLSQHLGIDKNRLLLSNGSDALFQLLLIAFALHSGKSVLTHQHAFQAYVIQAQTLGIPIIEVPLKSDWHIDIEAITQVSHQKNIAILFLANPNNPTGLLTSHDKIQQLMQQMPETSLVVLDEAYYEYAYRLSDKTSLHLLEQYPNLVITRTFSKAYGLAGLRIGYAIANPQIIELLQRTQLPFVINQAALEAATAALDDIDFVKQTLEINSQGIKQLQLGLDKLNFHYLPSSCNFITFDCKEDAQSIYQYLLKHGVIVRPLHPNNLPNYIRVTTGTQVQNARFLDTLARYIQDKK